MDLRDIVTGIYDISVPCNYRCVYCRCDWENPANQQQPEFNRIKPVIDKIINLNFRTIILTGGEFFTIHYWKDVLTYTKNKSKDLSIRLITNASSIKPQDIDFLENHVEQINVSFHSADRKLYKQIMGITSDQIFDDVLRNLRLLGDSRIKTGIFFSPLRVNYRQFYDTIKFLKDEGIKISTVNLNRIIPTQHTLNYFKKQKPLSYSEHKELIEQLVRIRRELHIDARAEAYPVCFLKKIIEDIHDGEPLPETDENKQKFCGGPGGGFSKEPPGRLIKEINQPCFLGRKAIAFNNDGTLKLCPATGFSIDEQTVDTFNKGEWRATECRDCPHWEICLGGCHASKGEIYSDDVLKDMHE